MSTKREEWFHENEINIQPIESKHITDLTGQTFNRWTIVGYAGLGKDLKAQWWCKCQCDDTKYYIRTGTELKNGKSKSCGCLISDANRDRRVLFKLAEKYNVEEKDILRLHRIFNGMKQRCYNLLSKDYPKYGKRGIKICDEWLLDPNAFDKWAFTNGYQSGLTIDRIDVNGDYTPDNCQWISVVEQNRNKTTTIYIDYQGERRTLSSVLHEKGIANNYPLYVQRIIRYGWDIDKAINEPVRTSIKKQTIEAILHYFASDNNYLDKREFCVNNGINLATFRRYMCDKEVQNILICNNIIDDKKGHLFKEGFQKNE